MTDARKTDAHLWAQYGYDNDLSVSDLQKRIDAFYENQPAPRPDPATARQPDDGKWAWFVIPLAFLLSIGAWTLLGMLAEWLLPR